MHPSTLLATLTTLAAIGGAWSWSAFKEKQTSPSNANNASAAAQPGGPQPMLPELGNGSVGDGPTGTLQRQVQRLEDQNQLLQKENQDLRAQLSKALQANAPPPTPESLAERMAALRALKFSKPPKYRGIPMEELQQRIKKAAEAQIPAADAEARSKAYLAMNFVVDAFSFRDAMVNAEVNQAKAVYDPAANEAFFQDDADLRRLDGRDKAMAAARAALLQQNYPVTHPLPLVSEQDDAARALRALTLGDTTFYGTRWALQDDLVNLTDGSPPGFPRQDYTPLYFSEQYKFCADQGTTFVDALLQHDGTKALAAAYGRLPKSSAELLHPELYLANPPFEPKEISPAEGQVEGAQPYFTNVAGEFSTDISFRYFMMSPDLAVRIAEGWAGDRYWVYAGDAQHGDQVLWKTQWRKPEDGQEFFDGMRRVLMQRYTIPYQKEYDQPGAFVVDDPHRIIRVRLSDDKLRVTVVNATDATLAAALDAKAKP